MSIFSRNSNSNSINTSKITSEKIIWIVDIETTWFFDQWWLIVEVGIASLNLDTWEVTWIYDSVVRENWFNSSHENSWIFDNSSLSFSEVSSAPSFQSQKSIIQSHIDLFAAWITAYNKDFDFTFLRDRWIKISKELPCPMIVATPVLKLPSTGYGDYKRPKVEEAWDFLVGTPYVEQHRWLDDAIHEARIVYELYKKWHFVI